MSGTGKESRSPVRLVDPTEDVDLADHSLTSSNK